MKTIYSRKWAITAMLPTLVTLAGCGPSDQVDVFPVGGVVTYEGEPMVGGGSIAFLPLDHQEGKGAGGIIDEQGRFAMSTYKDGDGSMPGKFRVVVTQSIWDEPTFSGDSDESQWGQAPQPVRRVEESQAIPTIYSHVLNSPLEVEITSDMKSELTIELTSSPNS